MESLQFLPFNQYITHSPLLFDIFNLIKEVFNQYVEERMKVRCVSIYTRVIPYSSGSTIQFKLVIYMFSESCIFPHTSAYTVDVITK